MWHDGKEKNCFLDNFINFLALAWPRHWKQKEGPAEPSSTGAKGSSSILCVLDMHSKFQRELRWNSLHTLSTLWLGTFVSTLESSTSANGHYSHTHDHKKAQLCRESLCKILALFLNTSTRQLWTILVTMTWGHWSSYVEWLLLYA